MKEKRISFCQGKGSLTHNNRLFIADNVDRSHIKDNITFIREDIGYVYEMSICLRNQPDDTTPDKNETTEKSIAATMNPCSIENLLIPL